MVLLYSSCVELKGAGILICGESGSGKSDLSLRLIEQGATLVSDDQTALEKNENGELKASAPKALEGFLEVRGLGIVSMPFLRKTTVKLKINLCPSSEINRMPIPAAERIEAVNIPVIQIDAVEPSAVAKIKLALSIQNGERKIIS